MAAMAAAWLVHRWAKLAAGDPAYAYGAVGNLLALVGLPLLVAMVALGSRFPLVERAFGLDRMLRAHKLLAKVVVCVFLAHALLRTLKLSMQAGEGWQWSALLSIGKGGAAMAAGRLALLGMIVLSPLALLGGRLVPWRVWKPAHLLLYPAVVLGFLHAKFRGDDLGSFPYDVVWYLLALMLAAILAYRAVYRILRRRWGEWSVAEAVEETHDTRSLGLAPAESIGPFGLRHAGQFATIRLKRRVGWTEPRPFTISSPPGDEQLRFTIKKAGWLSAAAHSLRPGARLFCEGPYGVFTPDFERERNLVLIAGGVGVTPFLSAIRYAHRAAPQTHVTLVWGNKTPADIIAREELENLTKCMWLKVVHVFSVHGEGAGPGQPPADGGAAGVFYERGFVKSELLKKHVDPHGASFYLCGPPAMQRFVLRELRKAFGVRRRQVKRELFFW
jgi:predicted ferric reductase